LGTVPKKFGSTKTSEFGADFGQLLYLIANISRTKQDVIEWKTALQTAISPADSHLI